MRKLLRGLLPIVVFALGVAALVALVKTRPVAKKVERLDPGTLVEVHAVQSEAQLVKVRAHGTVRPAHTVILSPEVSGVVRWTNPELLPGGRFAAGEMIARIDAQDYRLAAEQQYAAVDQAATALEVEKSRKKIAEREMELMRDGERKKNVSALALRDPQLRTAKVALKAAKSGLKRANRAVGKTVLRAPFNAMVQAKTVDVGQLVGPATPLVTLVGTDAFWVQVSIPVERLAWIDIPGVRGATTGSRALVWRQLAGQRVEKEGHVIRLMSDVDPMGRMAKVLVEVRDPLGLDRTQQTAVGEEPATEAGLPLLIGSFVEVAIDGREVNRAIEVPREALRDGDRVYVMEGERVDVPSWFRDMVFWADGAHLSELLTLNTLEIRDVTVVWRTEESVIVTEGLRTGELVITSPVPAPIDGMKVRTFDEEGGDGGDSATARAAVDEG